MTRGEPSPAASAHTRSNPSASSIDAQEWVDYLQQIKWNGKWKIINVVWEDRPQMQAVSGKR